MSVRLRAHHLLCMLTFVGEGYSADFTENLQRVVLRLNAGEEIELCDGPDDICAPLLSGPDAHCTGCSVLARDEAAAVAVEELLGGSSLSAGFKTTLEARTVARLRESFRRGSIRQACVGCQWHDLCTQVAQRDFDAAKLTGASDSLRVL